MIRRVSLINLFSGPGFSGNDIVTRDLADQFPMGGIVVDEITETERGIEFTRDGMRFEVWAAGIAFVMSDPAPQSTPDSQTYRIGGFVSLAAPHPAAEAEAIERAFSAAQKRTIPIEREAFKSMNEVAAGAEVMFDDPAYSLADILSAIHHKRRVKLGLSEMGTNLGEGGVPLMVNATLLTDSTPGDMLGGITLTADSIAALIDGYAKLRAKEK